ncbi:MAG: ABC transporter permease [Desulfobacterales bacterium]|nr:ABC transporter permease [Desulfobacterales bacterium]
MKQYIRYAVEKFNRFNSQPSTLTIIKPSSGWFDFDLKELKHYKNLFFFLIWRDIKVLYAQTILGISWAILSPLIQIVIFSVIFGRIAQLQTEGIPYIIFSSVAIIPWNYMSQSMTASSQSLVTGKNLLGKIYFPRLIFPLTPILAKLIDFFISILILVFLFFYFKVLPTWNLLFFPLFLLLMMSVSAGVGMWLSALAIRFRDVRLAMTFAIRMLMYSAPIVYSASSLSESHRFIYSLNPIVGIIEGFRACLLGTPIPWQFIWPGTITTLILFLGGAIYFKRMERFFVDVI